VDVTAAGFSVALIPHTFGEHNSRFKGSGAVVNLETDLLAKYVWKMLHAMELPGRMLKAQREDESR